MSETPRDRPRSRSLIAYDPDNFYERLGLSPLASTAEVENRLKARRSEAAREARSGRDDSSSDEVFEIDQIARAIEDPVKRQRYDDDNPQNVFLTVQASPVDRFRLPYHRAGMISEWLRETLGPDTFVPSPSCRRLWTLNAVDPALEPFLEQIRAALEAESAAALSPVSATSQTPRTGAAIPESSAGPGPALISPGEIESIVEKIENGRVP